MASLVLAGDTSGSITVSAPAVAGSNTQTLVATTGTLAPIVSGTAVASTSGTSIDFTGIPSWVKRITVMFNGVSTNGTSIKLVQIGSGSVTTTGYASTGTSASNIVGTLNSTAGFIVYSTNAADTISGVMTLVLVSGNTWVSLHSCKVSTTATIYGGGDITLSGTLDQVRITTVNGTDTFDAGTINLLWE
jgi:hypothetical protein